MGSVTTAPSAPALELPHASRSKGRLAAALSRIEPHALLVPVVAVYAIGLLLNLPNGVASDTWLALVSGREVAQHGLPAHDVLNVWSHGRSWIDQQWGAQLAFYGLYRLGGFKFMLFVFAALNVVTFGLVLAIARWRGGSQRSVLWLSLPCIFLLGWTSWVVRPQTFAYLLFVALLWLLIADSRNPSRRVFLVLPLLVLWENLHGTAVLATLLVGLRAVTIGLDGFRRTKVGAWLPRAAALLLGAALTLVASPYGLTLLTYDRRLLINPAIAHYVTEWQPTTPSLISAPFYAIAFLSIWLIGRHGNRLTRFEKLALLLTIVIAMGAIRSVVWFTLTALICVPIALDGAIADRTGAVRYSWLNRVVALASVAVFAVYAGEAAARPAAHYEKGYPQAAAQAVARAAAKAGSPLIFANEEYADWLIWEHPELRGRVAFDARFELLTGKQLRSIVYFRLRIGDWRAPTRQFGLLVLNSSDEKDQIHVLLTGKEARLLYRGGGIAVLDRTKG